jgi:hypothetical protein
VTGVYALLVVFLGLSAASCASESTRGSGQDKPAAMPRSTVELYFPLEEGKIYNYVTREGDETGMLVAKVHRPDAIRGELRLSNATKRFAYGPEGVSYEGGAFILKTPLDVGSSWRGEHGGTTTVASVDASVEVPAGHYSSCVRTVEQGGRPANSRYETTYCPGVGMVLLVVQANGAEARAELKSYGMPMKIE